MSSSIISIANWVYYWYLIQTIVIGNSLVIPPFVLTLVTTLSYISLFNLIYFRGTHFFSKTHYTTSLGIHYITSLGIPSYTFSRLMKTTWKSLNISLYFCIRYLNKKISSMVDHPSKKPNWFFDIVEKT